jgi:hypothetical protein
MRGRSATRSVLGDVQSGIPRPTLARRLGVYGEPAATTASADSAVVVVMAFPVEAGSLMPRDAGACGRRYRETRNAGDAGSSQSWPFARRRMEAGVPRRPGTLPLAFQAGRAQSIVTTAVSKRRRLASTVGRTLASAVTSASQRGAHCGRWLPICHGSAGRAGRSRWQPLRRQRGGGDCGIPGYQGCPDGRARLSPFRPALRASLHNDSRITPASPVVTSDP